MWVTETETVRRHICFQCLLKWLIKPDSSRSVNNNEYLIAQAPLVIRTEAQVGFFYVTTHNNHLLQYIRPFGDQLLEGLQ